MKIPSLKEIESMINFSVAQSLRFGETDAEEDIVIGGNWVEMLAEDLYDSLYNLNKR